MRNPKDIDFVPLEKISGTNNYIQVMDRKRVTAKNKPAAAAKAVEAAPTNKSVVPPLVAPAKSVTAPANSLASQTRNNNAAVKAQVVAKKGATGTPTTVTAPAKSSPIQQAPSPIKANSPSQQAPIKAPIQQAPIKAPIQQAPIKAPIQQAPIPAPLPGNSPTPTPIPTPLQEDTQPIPIASPIASPIAQENLQPTEPSIEPILQTIIDLTESSKNLSDIEAAVVADATKELNNQQNLSPAQKVEKQEMIQQLNEAQATLEAEKNKEKVENKKLRQNAMNKIKENKQEIAKSGVNDAVLTAAMQPPTQSNKANISAAIGTLSPNVANLVEKQKALTAVVNANPNQPISAEVEVKAKMATASETTSETTMSDEDIEWERFFLFSVNAFDQDNIFKLLEGIDNSSKIEYNKGKIEEGLKKSYYKKKDDYNIFIRKHKNIIEYFKTIDTFPYFMENTNAAPIKEDIKKIYNEIKENVKNQMEGKNIEDEEIKGFFGTNQNPFYILKTLRIVKGMITYLLMKSNAIQTLRKKRDKELITENENLLKAQSNIDFLTELKEKKSADAAPYADVFGGKVKNYYGLKPSDELKKFMIKRVKNYKIEARIRETKKKDINTLLDEYLLTFLNEITIKSKYKVDQKVGYEKSIMVNANLIKNGPIQHIEDEIYIHGKITKIIKQMYSIFGEIHYFYDIKNDMKHVETEYAKIKLKNKYNNILSITNVEETTEYFPEQNISPITAGGRKFTKKRKINKKKKNTIQKYKKHFSKKHFSKKCRKTYRAKHISKKCHKIPLIQPLKQPLRKVGPNYKPKL